MANGQAANPCNEEASDPGCFDTTCSKYICSALPTCCSDSWNATCADLAQEIFRPQIVPFNGTEPSGSSNGKAACPNGFICDGNERMANCTELQLAAIEFYEVGDVFGGISCPRGKSTIQNCPVGSYCPTPEVVEPCPSGYFCPHKSRDPDLFDCDACDAGSTAMKRDQYGYVVLGILLALALAYIFLVMLKTYKKDLYDELVKLQQRQTDSLRMIMTQNQKKQDEQLERIRPKLEIISSRLEKMSNQGTLVYKRTSVQSLAPSGSTTNVASNIKDPAIGFDTRRMFEILDTNDDKQLSYDELNAVMELRSVELHEFVRRMNDLDTTIADSHFLSKLTFVKYFLQVLEETTHFTVTPDEAAELFDSIVNDEQTPAKNNKSTIRSDWLYTSSISNFLTDAQINAMIKKFRNVNHHLEASQRSGGGAGAGDGANSSKRDESERANSESSRLAGHRGVLGKSSAFINTIAREDFIKHYPTILEQVTVDFEPSRLQQDILEHGMSAGMALSARSKLGVDICFQDLSLTVKVGDKCINVVDHVSGRVQAQTMTALMGGSGAGKTSLLNALCGRAYYGETIGAIHINGQETAIERIMDRVGFVPQDDVVYAELTVRENLIYAGKFRLPRGTPDDVISDLADETLANLGLSRVANSMVGDVHRRGVSGGEKKRVNIGLELMACPSILFLDEPTSGLDSSSALLVMQSLKNLVDSQGMTIVSVIHQPRKFIFDLFDSLILLGVGGRMVYHGPVPQARPYFEERNYELPLGESLADWLIDISSGRLEPSEPEALEDSVASLNANAVDRVVSPRGVSAGKQKQAVNDAKSRRAWLYEEWKTHYTKLNSEEREIYDVPDQYDLPGSVTKSPFPVQLYYQVTRAALVSYRNRFTKILDTVVVVGAMVIISLLEGVVVASRDDHPELDFDEATRPSHDNITEVFYQLFKYSLVRHWGFALKSGLIIAVLIGLQATKIITTKRVEFFREAASGYDLNAYFLAVNIVATLEHSVQIMLASFFSIWIRNPLGSWASYFVHFLALTWVSVSWALFFPQVIPPENVTVVIGFFFAFCGLLLGGAFPPMTYKTIYDDGGFTELFSGWISPLRFFIEALTVGEYRCMPEQSGLTVAADTLNFPRSKAALSVSGMAGHDINATLRSCSGWYWGLLPSIFVGITIRFAAVGAMHAFNRGKQTKKPLLFVIKNNKRALYVFIGFWVILAGLFGFTCWTMVREAPTDDSIKDAEARQKELESTAQCFLSGSCTDPLDYFTEATVLGNFSTDAGDVDVNATAQDVIDSILNNTDAAAP
eukprot:CAMPEP_0119548188 /NCGR_PEP_ID=MMETSP1352-20130426/2157_1 /TAXON_ID=265584 /ORGANISM="Stauroneis constricta, Strain CCMP1120" /LENGTH=1292 /DNA_ID=CAMNT_0007593377 /DNA_START=125 /DNA_END=4003 /DNA_ORIENTATION=-